MSCTGSGNRVTGKRRLLNLRAAVGVLLSPITATDRGTDSHRILQEYENQMKQPTGKQRNRMNKREPEIITTVGTPVSVVQESTGMPIADNAMAGILQEPRENELIWVLICVQD
jgi:hypothetical protein